MFALRTRLRQCLRNALVAPGSNVEERLGILHFRVVPQIGDIRYAKNVAQHSVVIKQH
jgi:hypothetical protein